MRLKPSFPFEIRMKHVVQTSSRSPRSTTRKAARSSTRLGRLLPELHRLGRGTLVVVVACLVPLIAGRSEGVELLDGEFGAIDLGRPLIEPDHFPTLRELRAAVRKKEMSAVLLLKLSAHSSNHHLPVWSRDGQRLALQRGERHSNSSKLLFFSSLSQAEPTLLSTESDTYDYMFRWGMNSQSSFAFSRIEGSTGATQVYYSLDGLKWQARTQGNARCRFPSLYQRTDGIWRLAYERDGELVQEAWNDQGPIEAPVELGRGSSPLWARDGARLLIVRERSSGRQLGAVELVVRNLKTGADAVIPTAPGDTLRNPAWSPDEHQVAFYARASGDNQPWQIQVSRVEAGARPRALGNQVVVNLDFETEGPAWQPDGKRVWFFSDANRKQAYYPVVAADLETGVLTVVDYSNRCTTPNDLAVNPATAIPEMALVARDGLTQDLFVLLLNHY